MGVLKDVWDWLDHQAQKVVVSSLVVCGLAADQLLVVLLS